MNLSKINSKVSRILPKRLLPFVRKYFPNHIRDIYIYHKNDSVNKELEFLIENGPITFSYGFPYEWVLEKKEGNVIVNYDESRKLPYVISKNHRIYYPASMSDEEIQTLYNNVVNIEQDVRSPHCYFTKTYGIDYGDIVVDCGASEGFFSIDKINIIKHLYLFEPDERWVEPLKATYAPWINKVSIITKYLSSETDEQCTTLDEFFKNKELPTMIKMDVEGFEKNILDGAKNLLTSDKLCKIVACVYHHADDEKILSEIMTEHGFNVTISEGYTLLSLDFKDGERCPPYLRHGVIRCRR